MQKPIYGPPPFLVVFLLTFVRLFLQYHAGVNIAVIVSERPTWKKLPVYDGLAISKFELLEMFAFSQSLGQEYSGKWLVKAACPWKIFSSTRFVDGPPCFGVLIEILDIAGNGNPQIGLLTVRFLESGDVRNSPCQSAPAIAGSLPITGDWGITIPFVERFYARNNGADEVYGRSDELFVKFSELTNRAGLIAAQMDKTTLDQIFFFDQGLGTDYEGLWLEPDLVRVHLFPFLCMSLSLICFPRVFPLACSLTPHASLSRRMSLSLFRSPCLSICLSRSVSVCASPLFISVSLCISPSFSLFLVVIGLNVRDPHACSYRAVVLCQQQP